jgi:hypothetical protein
LSCSQTALKKKETTKYFKYRLTDISGEYFLEKKVYFLGNKLLSEVKLYELENKGKELEKSYGLFVLEKDHFYPYKIQSTLWVDKEKFFSEIDVSKKEKSYIARWKDSEKKETIPKNKNICSFYTLELCLQKVDRKDQGKLSGIYILWDIYPNHQKLFEGVSDELITKARVKYDGKNEGSYRFTLEIIGQSIMVELDKEFELSKLAWVAQAYSIIRVD